MAIFNPQNNGQGNLERKRPWSQMAMDNVGAAEIQDSNDDECIMEGN